MEGTATETKSSGLKKSPTDFLKQVIGKPVVVKLHSGVTYKGVLACLDGFMNIAMEQTEEYVDDQLKNKYGDCFIRGNNGKCFLCHLFSAILSLSSLIGSSHSSLYLCNKGQEVKDDEKAEVVIVIEWRLSLGDALNTVNK